MPRKRTWSFLHERMPPVRIYKDEIEAIAEILSETKGSVVLATDDYEYDDIQEFFKNESGLLKSLTIKSSTPSYIFVGLRRDGAVIESYSDDTHVVGAVAKIGQVLRAQKTILPMPERNTAQVLSGASSVILFVLFLSIFEIDFSKPLKDTISATPFTGWLLLATMVTIVVGAAYANIARRYHCLVYASSRSDAQGFWKRNSDQLWLMVVGVVVGSVATILVQLVLSMIGGTP